MSIPKWTPASAAVAQAKQFAGPVKVAELPRLREAVAMQPDDVLQAEIGLGERYGKPWLKGQARGSLTLRCERCERAFAWPLDLAFELRLVDSDAEEKVVLSDADPYRIEDDRLQLYELLEDEVLLALPMLPRCGSCENAIQSAPQAPVTESTEERPENPFERLKGLKLGK